MRPTIHDVAHVAGVSIKTVSRVLNKEKHVREQTRLKVERAVEQLDFRPSQAARALAGNRSFQVALLYDNPSPYYIYHIQIGVSQRCHEHGFRAIFQPSDIHASDFVERIKALIDETRLDGLILSSPVGDQNNLLTTLKQWGIPFVRIDAGEDLSLCPAAFIDDVAAAKAMTLHLVALGHREIGFIVGHPDHRSAYNRLQGYKQGLQQSGIAFDDRLLSHGLYTFESGRQAADDLLNLPNPPTAIFASNDDMAAGVLSVAHARGIKLPDQLSIAGFDDTDMARAVWPALSTIRQPLQELGRAATDLLLQAPSATLQRVLKYELILRSSTARRK
jgi:LacI family transcriptional regulator